MQATVEQYNAALNSARARLAVLTGMQAEAIHRSLRSLP